MPAAGDDGPFDAFSAVPRDRSVQAFARLRRCTAGAGITLPGMESARERVGIGAQSTNGDSTSKLRPPDTGTVEGIAGETGELTDKGEEKPHAET